MHVKLNENLDVFPGRLFEQADTLEVLDLSGNPLSSLPEDFHRFTALRVLFLSGCRFRTWPMVLSHCGALEMIAFKNNGMQYIPDGSFPPRLRWLILTGNELESLPDSLGRCEMLEKCMLAGNRLSDLPRSMGGLSQLRLLRLSANRLRQLPAWLLSLPRLSWLAFAGNPCTPTHVQTTMTQIHSKLDLGPELGVGASGTIYRSRWQDRDVAIKVFGGALTSDGLPKDELRACIAAGRHAHIIDALAHVDLPDHQALVLELVPPSYTPLGRPPSWTTCSRDTFAGHFDATLSMEVAQSIASAAEHLHSRSVNHGDLYAHNVLVDAAKAHCLLGDFGAATYYGAVDTEQAKAIERIEVRAFGYLLDDLVSNAAPDTKANPALLELRTICLNLDPARRPLFADIVGRLWRAGVPAEP